jgi:hypothetical protein
MIYCLYALTCWMRFMQLMIQSFDSVKPISLSHGRGVHSPLVFSEVINPLVLISINAMEQGKDST